MKWLFLLLLCVAECVGPIAATAGAEQSGVTYEEFQKLSYGQRRTLIVELPVDLRVRAYLDMVDEFHPPDIDLAGVVAPGGDELVPVVWRALEDETSDMRFRNGLFLLREIDKGGHARVGAYRGLMRFLRERTARVEPAVFRDECEDLLGGIRR